MVTVFQSWRLDVARFAPHRQLSFTIASALLALLEPLERAIVLLIESPVLDVRRPVDVELVGARVVRPDGSL